MDFLALCKRAALEASITNVPISVTGQSKELQRLINWVADAWTDLEGSQQWSWQWESPTLTLTAGASTIAGTIPAVRWDKEGAYLGTVPLTYLPWDEFRSHYPAPEITDGTPTVWTVRPDLAFAVNRKPLASTGIMVERYKLPTPLVLDTDTPALPEDLHMYLVWQAVNKYASRDEAGSLFQTTAKYASDLKASICERCLPEFRLGGALA